MIKLASNKISGYEWKGVNPIHTLGGIQEVLCLKDVCDVLGYANASDAINQHCKGVAKRYPLQTTGGIQEVRILNEPDTYRLITGSTLPEAERFESWLFEDVLPSIRKTGGYQIPDTAHDLPVIESSLVLDFQGVPILFLIALAATKSSGYDDDQVLNTPHVAVPRVDIAVFLCQIGFAPMGEWLVRKAGRTSTCVCSNSPTNALNSVERSLACRSIPA